MITASATGCCMNAGYDCLTVTRVYTVSRADVNAASRDA